AAGGAASKCARCAAVLSGRTDAVRGVPVAATAVIELRLAPADRFSEAALAAAAVKHPLAADPGDLRPAAERHAVPGTPAAFGVLFRIADRPLGRKVDEHQIGVIAGSDPAFAGDPPNPRRG